MSEPLSAYELKRLENIAANQGVLRGLGLGGGEPPPPPPKKKQPQQPRKRQQQPATTRVLRARRGEGGDAHVELMQPMQPAQPMQPEEYVPDKANFTRVRFTGEQLEMLESLAPTEPLSAHELAMLPYLRKFLHDNTNYKTKHVEKRTVLREGLRRFGMRQPPEWINEIGDCDEIGFGEDKEGASKAKTLFPLECAAVGLGFQSPLWRSTFGRGVGILLEGVSTDAVVAAAQRKQRDGAEEEEAAEEGDEAASAALQPLRVAPRLLSLGSDIELLRLEKMQLQAACKAVGVGLSNGACRTHGWEDGNHPLGKLYKFQELLLQRRFGETPAAPPLWVAYATPGTEEDGGEEREEARDSSDSE